jgi:hypothetical protein
MHPLRQALRRSSLHTRIVLAQGSGGGAQAEPAGAYGVRAQVTTSTAVCSRMQVSCSHINGRVMYLKIA